MSDVRVCGSCHNGTIHTPFTQGGYTGMMCGYCRYRSDLRPIPGLPPDMRVLPLPWEPAPLPRPQQPQQAPRPPVEYGESGKPICHLTQRGMGEDERRGGWCINEAVYGTLGRAGRDNEAGEFAQRIARVRGVTNKEVYKEIFKIALDYVEVR